MCSGRRCGSTDMQHDLFGSGHDLDLRSNFQHDLLRSYYISFDAPRQEKHDAGKISIVSLLSQKLLQKTFVAKNCYFWSFCSLEAKPLNVDQIWGHISERALKELSNALLRCSSSSSRVMRQFVEKCWNRLNLAFGDLWWPDVWPVLKIYRNFPVIIFAALSITAYRVSLRGPGAELEGGVKPPPQHDPENRPPARRGLIAVKAHARVSTKSVSKTIQICPTNMYKLFLWWHKPKYINAFFATFHLYFWYYRGHTA